MSPNAASSCVARAPHVPVPFGYAAVDKKIVVIPAEAEAVRTIFARYFELRSVVITALSEETGQPSLCVPAPPASAYSRGPTTRSRRRWHGGE
jgi:hypothetical protein